MQDQHDAGFGDPSRVFFAVHPSRLQAALVVLSSQPLAVTETVATLPASGKVARHGKEGA